MIIFAEQLTQLEKQFLELLEKDLEFRRAVIGMLELEEILQRLRKHNEKFEKILERLDRHESELVKLREDMNKLREDMTLGFKRHDEILERHTQEIAKLREDFNKMLNVIIQIQ